MATRAGQNEDRRAKAEALMAQQRRSERRRKLLAIGVPAVIVILVIVGVVFTVVRSNKSGSESASSIDVAQQIIPAALTGTAMVQAKPAQVANTTGISGVVAYDTKGYPYPLKAAPDAGTLGHDHVTVPVTYAVTPPVGGPHNAIWMNAGVYTKPVPNERAVHNLEHGAVWITYRPDLAASSVDALRAFVAKQSMIDESAAGTPGQANRYMDLSPWASDALPAPIVISSWGYQLKVTSATDPRLQQFVDKFRDSSTYTPEYGSPVDGIPVETGGRPAADGSKLENPAGAAQ